MLKHIILLFVLISSFTNAERAYSTTEKLYTEQKLGISAGVRVARIPFATDETTVTNFVLGLQYEDDRVYIDGFEGGLKLIKSNTWQLNALGRLRFFDIPKKYQNQIQEDTFDIGPQLRFIPHENVFIEFEILSDQDYRFHSNLRTGLEFDQGSLEWSPYVNFDFKTSNFNDYYYGLDIEDVDAGIDISAGLKARYHLIKNLYLTGSYQITWLGHNARGVSFVDKNYLDEAFFGLEISNERDKQLKESLGISPYLRVAHGWATPSNIGEIIGGDTESDSHNNQLTSIFYGHPLTDDVFGFPLDIYLTPGFVWHWHSDVQSSTQEFVVAIKAYYTFKWPIVWRFGFGEGVSYVLDVTYIEETELVDKDYEASKLMNYLDFSLDLNIGELAGKTSLSNLWLGYYIHHRSAIFETASHYGRIKGGSNYNAVYLQWHF
jgi:outer membrane protein